jgi:four helix bundle protein
MSKADDILIFKKSYELAQQILKATRLFPKSQRFLMASRLEDTVIRLLEYIIQANEARQKIPQLDKASQLLERLRILIRLSKDSSYIDFKKYENLSKATDEVGRMLGGWIKYSLGKKE